MSPYEQDIIHYYETQEASYTDGWDLRNSHAMHYGYKDATTQTFGATLLRMNAVLAKAANIQATDTVLDAGCGVGGSSLYLAQQIGCHCTGITLSQKQAAKATVTASHKGLTHLTTFTHMSYLNTTFASNSFDVVWGLESICYATNKKAFVQEAYRLLKPGGRLIIADGMVTNFENNQHPIIKNWLKGWLVNYLESPANFVNYYKQAGFNKVTYTDITDNTKASSRRLLLIYYASKLWGLWRKVTLRYNWTPKQELNINACKYQYQGMQQGLWGYGMVVGTK